ncbi:MAG: hypothetical protein PHC97_02635 [Patescibacteria group bacterium]|nr:hypothetical protein [Patescibacteria group bacterium]
MKKFFTVSIVVVTIMWSIGLAGFVPSAQAVTFSSGDLIKASLPAVYYYGADGKRYVFPNEKTYKTWYADFSTVRTITDGELATIAIGGNVTYKPGVKMVKITTDPKVYAVAANGQLRWITTESIASTLYGATWTSKVEDVSDAFFTNYTVGAPINNASDYSPSAATAGAQSINVDKGLAGSVTTGGNLNVSLASDTPAASTVADTASANFTKITLSAGNTAATVKSMYITRTGLSSNDDVSNIKLVAMNGATVGSVASLGSNSKALVTFVPSLSIPANTSVSYFIRASIGLAPWGNTIALGISTASDVVLDAGTVTGAFPVMGNYMSVVLVADLGSVSVDKNALPPDSKPDAGSKRVQVSQFEVNAGPGEDLTVETISLLEAGTASNVDYANIELYSLTEGRTLGTVAAFDANSRVTFSTLNVVIPKGAKHIFQVYTDVVSGSGNTLNLDLTDGTDALVTVKGNTYGFYLTPVILNGWDGKGTDQTVNTGILNITKDVSSPATGNITQASEQPLTTWAFEVRGEAAKITRTIVKLTLGGGLLPANITNAKLVDETGSTIAGPRAITNDATGATCGFVGVCAVFTDTYIVPTGTHKFTFKTDIIANAGVAAVGTIRADIATPNTDITATGMNTRDNMTISTAAANGNVQTILAVALSAATLTQPAARTVAVGTQNFVWATASLDATASGEDVRVSAVTVRDTFTSVVVGADFREIQNLSIWADLTPASSTRGDAYETKVSNNEQPAAGVSPATKAISLTQVITVPKGSYVKIAVVGDLSTLGDTVTPNRHTMNVSAVTASGKSTGNTPAVAYSGAGQQMTDSAAGILTTSLDASSPSKSLLIASSTKQTVAVYKLQANNVEDLDIDDVRVTDTGTNGAITAISLTTGATTGIVSAAGTVTVTSAVNHTLPIVVGSTINITVNGAAYGTCNGTFAATTTGAATFTYAAPVGCVTSATAGTWTALPVITSAGHGLATGDTVRLSGTDSTPVLGSGPFTVTTFGVNNFTVSSATVVTVVGTTGTWARTNRTTALLGPVATSWYLYSSSRADGGAITDPVAVASGGSVATFVLADNTVTIPANGSVTLTVKIDVAPVDAVTVGNADPIQARVFAAGDIHVTGKSSGQQTANAQAAIPATHFAYESRPYFSLNASSPSGALVPGANTLLAIFNVKADNNDDVTFDGPTLPVVGANTLKITISSHCTAGPSAGLVLKDEDGNILDNATLAATDICTPAAAAFLFAQKDFVIPKGQTKKLYIYGNTAAMTNLGDSVQLLLNDAAASTPNLNWSINYNGGNYVEDDVIFRGGIYANALVKP